MEQNCRNCGAPPTKKQNKCEYCDTITHSNGISAFGYVNRERAENYITVKTSYKKPSTK